MLHKVRSSDHTHANFFFVKNHDRKCPTWSIRGDFENANVLFVALAFARDFDWVNFLGS